MKASIKHVMFLLWLCLLPLHAHAKLQLPIKVEATTQDLAAIAKAVGGELVEVQSLTLGTRDPHFAVAKPSMIRRVHQADLLLLIGADLEIGWLPALLQSARNPRVQTGQPGYLDLSNAVKLLDVQHKTVSRAMGDVHSKGNPHYWLDPRNGIRIANAIANRLAELAPGQAEVFKQNAKQFTDTINQKFPEWKQALQSLQGQSLIAYHTSFIYLADAFGFTIVDEVEPKPGVAPSVTSLKDLINRIKNEKIKQLIIEPFYDLRSANYLKQHTGIQVAVTPQSVGAQSEITDYIQLFDHIVLALNPMSDS